jgi:hypothetical protein
LGGWRFNFCSPCRFCVIKSRPLHISYHLAAGRGQEQTQRLYIPPESYGQIQSRQRRLPSVPLDLRASHLTPETKSITPPPCEVVKTRSELRLYTKFRNLIAICALTYPFPNCPQFQLCFRIGKRLIYRRARTVYAPLQRTRLPNCEDAFAQRRRKMTGSKSWDR